MAKGIAALAGLPKIDLVLPAGNAASSIESYRALVGLLARMQSQGLANGTYNNQIARGSDPFYTSVWNIVIATGKYTCTFVSDSNTDGGAVGRAALSTRRNVDITKLTSVNLASLKSFLAALNYIEKMEDLVAKKGSGSAGDIAATSIYMRGNTPFESYEWNIAKSGAAYTLVTTANS